MIPLWVGIAIVFGFGVMVGVYVCWFVVRWALRSAAANFVNSEL